MTHKVRKVAEIVAVGAVAALAAPSAAQAAMASKSGSLSCQYGYVGLVKTVTTMDVDGWAPGGYRYLWDWGTWEWQTHYKSGAISGSWLAESSAQMDTANTYASCA